eukprot:709603-Prorocentrum_minimum.AAC.1
MRLRTSEPDRQAALHLCHTLRAVQGEPRYTYVTLGDAPYRVDQRNKSTLRYGTACVLSGLRRHRIIIIKTFALSTRYSALLYN